MELNRAASRDLLSFLILFALVGPGAGTVAHGQTTGESPPRIVKQVIPEQKKTVLGLYVTAKEAYEKWEAAPGKTQVLDVRTPEEHLFVGHPEMAWNIPIALQTYEWDSSKKRLTMAPNPDFLSRVRDAFTPRDTLLVICRSGSRSARAVNQLAEAGFTSVYNVIDGMEGDKVEDPASLFHGKRMKNGWKNSGLPWTYDLNQERIRLP